MCQNDLKYTFNQGDLDGQRAPQSLKPCSGRPDQTVALFRLPLRPFEILTWVWIAWFLIAEKLIIVGLALISFYWFQPSQKNTKAFAVGWIALMYFRNLILMSAVAEKLHLYFYTLTKQGQYLKYDPRPLMKKWSAIYLGWASQGQHVLDFGQRCPDLNGV